MAASRSTRSELRAAVHIERRAGCPSGLVGGEKGDRSGDNIGFGELFDGLKAECHVAAFVVAGEARHVGLHHAGCDCVLTDALETAQKHGFLAWQSRCSLSLARLRHMKGDAKAALNAIFPVTQQSAGADDIGVAGPTLTGREANRSRPRRY